MKKKKLVWIVIALLAAGGLSAYLATRKGPPPVMKPDPPGGPEARVVRRLTKEGMDAAKATRNSDAKLKKVAGRMKKEELEVLKQRLAALQESEFQNAEIIRFRTDPNNIEIRLTNGVIVRIFKNNNRYQIVGCSEKPPAES